MNKKDLASYVLFFKGLNQNLTTTRILNRLHKWERYTGCYFRGLTRDINGSIYLQFCIDGPDVDFETAF